VWQRRKGGASRNRYSNEYKAEALALGEKIGVAAAAGQLREILLSRSQIAYSG
jgi:transposase-like protein